MECGMEHALTNFSKQIFSRRAPIQPVNPKTNMMDPTIIKIKAGSMTISSKKPWYFDFSMRA